MPELPEVETVRIQLKYKLIGQTIQTVEVFHDKSAKSNSNFEDNLIGKTISDIDRVGKLMIFAFAEDDNLFLLAHLKMTGQFFFVEDDDISGGGHSVTKQDFSELPNKHTRIAYYFSDGSALYFNDVRIFGYNQLVNRDEKELAKQRFGPEPITDDFDVLSFAAKLKKRKTPIKAALLDQTLVAGLGNIYVDEALFRAGVRPTRRADKVTKKEAIAIAKAAGDVMKESIKVGGTTFQSFKDTGGYRGNFVKHLEVFGRQGQECPRCGTIIKKIRCAGRGTHYCPQCQK